MLSDSSKVPHRPEPQVRRAARRRQWSVGHERWIFETAFAVATALAVALVLSIVGRHAGWPSSHEATDPTIETQIYAAHFRQFDLFPVWSSSDAFGLGTPAPLFYQKAFFYLSGAIYLLLGGHIKWTLILSSAAFMVVGVYGMRFAIATVTQRSVLLTIGAIALIFTNFSLTDWLVRGDFAEFSAMMLVPWLLWWCLTLVTARRASFAIIPILTLLIIAHDAIALASLIALLVAIATFLVFAGLPPLKGLVRNLAISGAAIVVLLSPLLVADLKFDRDYSPASKITQFGYQTSAHFVAPVSYFLDTSFHWLHNFPNYTVQINYAIWIPIAVGLIVLSS